MLKPDVLEQNLLDLFNTTLPVAFEQAMLETFGNKSKKGEETAKKFGTLRKSSYFCNRYETKRNYQIH